MQTDTNTLQQNALALCEIDRKIVETIVGNKLEELIPLLESFSSLKHEIQITLIDVPFPENLNTATQEILRRIRAGDQFHADKLINAGRTLTKDASLIDSLTDDEIDELGLKLFYSWFSHYEYIRNLYGLGSLIVGVRIPVEVQIYFDEARTCYAFQQFHAVLALCRAFLEATIKEIHRKLYPSIKTTESEFAPLLKSLPLNKEFKDRIRSFYYGKASPIVHGDKNIDVDGARLAILKTMELVEELYRTCDQSV